jgi:soluble lytic murein transglycosylase-like protein
MRRLLVSACVAGLAISGAGVRAAETASATTETGTPAPLAKAGAKASHANMASIKPGKPAKGKIPLPMPKPAEAEAGDADAAAADVAPQPEVQAEATPADAQTSEAAPADATDAAPDSAPKPAEAKLETAKPSYMKTGHPEIDALVATHARANNVPEALIHRVIVRESKYQKDLVGSCGCIGLMQIKLGTARGLGYTGDAQGLHDPNTNLTYGVKYLAGAYRAANGDHDRAIRYFAKGYYEVAKRQRLADAQPLSKPEKLHAPLDITPKPPALVHIAKHASRAPTDKQATASR